MSIDIGVAPGHRTWSDDHHPDQPTGYGLAKRIAVMVMGSGAEPVWQTPRDSQTDFGRWDLDAVASNNWFLTPLATVGPEGGRVFRLSGRAITGPSDFSRKFERGLRLLLETCLGVKVLNTI